MTRYIAFLRAVNVGKRLVKMSELRTCLADAGLVNVQTYIQSGNVFFDSDKNDRTALTHFIEEVLQKTFGFAVPVFLRTVSELQAIIERDPFKNVEMADTIRTLVIFTSAPIPQGKLPFSAQKGDSDYTVLSATNGEAFIVVNQHNRPGNPNDFIEKTFGVTATGRFFHTTVKILKAATSN